MFVQFLLTWTTAAFVIHPHHHHPFSQKQRHHEFFTTSLFSAGDASTPSSAPPTPLSSTTLPVSSCLYGGDFAGVSASFDATLGTIIPVPEHYVPDALLEWGEAPNMWEAIVSEVCSDSQPPPHHVGIGDDDDSSDDAKQSYSLLQRQTLQILPEVGCGVDNLDVNQQCEELKMMSLLLPQQQGNINASDSSVFAAFDTPLEQSGGVTRTETTFALPDNHRLRVVANIQCNNDETAKPSSFRIQTPIIIHMERLVSRESSNGTMAKGGGLTGSKVSEMIGPTIRKVASSQPSCEHPRTVESSSGASTTFLHAQPFNITIATTTSSSLDGDVPWRMEITYNACDEGDGAKQTVQRYPFQATKQVA